MKTVLLFLVFGCCLEVTFGSCYAKVEDGDHCTTMNGVTMVAGSDLLIPENCSKCTCTRQSDTSSLFMSCCGYGIYAGVHAPPPGCKVTTGEDGCSLKIEYRSY